MAVATQPTMSGLIDKDQLKRLAAGRWPEIITAVAGVDPQLLDGKHHPCPKCGGTDRFRCIDRDAGALHCNQCFSKGNGDGLAAIGWLCDVQFRESLQLVADHLGIAATTGRAELGDIIENVARAKSMPVDAFRQFGVKSANRGKATVARVDVYNEHGKVHSHFDLSPDGKGWFRKGAGSAGLFFPGRLPRGGETWLLVEGVKDAAALVALDFLACGLNNADMASKYAELFRGVQVIIVPDLDKAGLEGAQKTVSRTYGIASAVSIARLPGEIKARGGEDVRDVLRQANGETLVRKTIKNAPPWEPKEPDGDKPTEPIGIVTNAKTQAGEKGKVVVLPLTMREIITRTRTQTDNWPRRVDRAMFVHDEKHGIGWLEKPSALFGWLASRVGKVSWREGGSFVQRGDYFSELQRTSDKYRSVETLPHEPRYADHYYTCGTVQPGKGDTLNRLLDRFCPATDIDRDLLTAALATPAWGGPCGTRPAFVITSDDGRGSGKTTVAKVIGHLWGGLLSFSHNEDVNRIKTRMLSPEALTVRACLLDNVKSLRFSWSELEAMITGPVIGGHRMYVGEATRPNTLTWYITLNGASLSTDMAQRSVIIKVKKPKRSATWEEDTTRFVDAHRDELIADCIGVLRRDPFPLEKFTRWASWEKDILQRMPEPADAQTVIVERQGIADAESDAAELLEEYFGDQLSRLHYSPDRDQVFIPSGVVADWYNRCLNEKQKTVSVGRLLTQMIHEGSVTRLRPNKARSLGGRGFIWMGPKWDSNETINTDLIERIERYQG